MSTAAQWRVEIKREFEEQMGSVADAVRYVGDAAIRRIVQKAPVDTGRFKGNWFVTINAPTNATTPEVDPNGAETISKGQAVLASYPDKTFPSIYVQNNLPYAERLENGYSTQAPGGMVGITTVELAALWNAVKLP